MFFRSKGSPFALGLTLANGVPPFHFGEWERGGVITKAFSLSLESSVSVCISYTMLFHNDLIFALKHNTVTVHVVMHNGINSIVQLT